MGFSHKGQEEQESGVGVVLSHKEQEKQESGVGVVVSHKGQEEQEMRGRATKDRRGRRG